MSKSNWKKMLTASVVGLSALVLAACGGGGEATGDVEADTDTGPEGSEEVVELEFWSFWGAGARRDTIESIIEDFNESQDGIEVEHVYQPYGDIWTKALAGVTAGNPPDVIVQDIMNVGQRADAQQATNIQKYLDQEDENIESRFYPQLWDTVIHEDEAYGLPFNTDTQVLFYNKDMFEEAGLDPEQPPATWAELDEYARQLDIQDGDSWERVGFYPLWDIGAETWALNADNGVFWFDEDNNIQVNTPEKVEALERILDAQEYYGRENINAREAEFGSGVSDPFASGQVAIRGQNINYYKELRENAPENFNFGIAPLPAFEEGQDPWTWGGGFTLEIPYGADHPEGSYEFMKYLTSTEVQERFGTQSFDIMANQEANQNLVNHPNLDETGQMVYELADQNLEHTVITPTPLIAPDYKPLIMGQIDEALLGNKSAQEALDDAQESVESLVEQND